MAWADPLHASFTNAFAERRGLIEAADVTIELDEQAVGCPLESSVGCSTRSITSTCPHLFVTPLLERSGDPNVRVSRRKDGREYRDVTPLSWGDGSKNRIG